jgi:hypothetical protein
MTGRLPWVAATLVAVIVAGMGAWALSTPPAQFAIIKAVPSEGGVSGNWFTPGWFTAAVVTAAENSGIENVYIVDNYWTPDNFVNYDLGLQGGEDMDNDPNNYLLAGSSDAVITGDDDNATIPYESPFKIVVAVRIEADADEWAPKRQRRLVAYVNEDNMYVFLDWSPSTDIGETYNVENSELTGDGPDAYERYFGGNVSWTKNSAAYDGFDGTTAEPNHWARINVVFTNANKNVYATPPETGTENLGFRLAAGTSITLDNIDLWIWA